MTTFLDGPASGQKLMLMRTPIFLRVVLGGGKWDALNEKGDKPRSEERLYCYKLTANRGTAHVYFGGSRGGWYPISDYSFRDPQPTEAQMRTEAAWGAWCESQPEAKQHGR